ncbi:hypothetical protein JVU11DRAFT_2877 [Chiua virens]|nr:hypothetical protein JVU11DRAFT_2877 [Chiua virens]
MVPEIVAKDAYDPIRADLWSCAAGVDLSLQGHDEEFLVEIARQLVHDDPLEHPMMAQMVAFESCIVEPPRLRFSFPMVAPEI